ncbi:hypothetical protein MPSEU_000651300 [Mayamaea pseudoterrestris]|nr:hypothetical protein MPSEU_000651300 [Mayamaea pseudoterrestris]
MMYLYNMYSHQISLLRTSLVFNSYGRPTRISNCFTNVVVRRKIMSEPPSSSTTRRNKFLAAPRQFQRHENHRRIPPYILFTAGGTLLVIGGTYYAFLDRVPLTNRQRWIATTTTMEQELGDSEYQQLLQQFRGAILPPQHRATRTVQRVGNRIVAAAQEFMTDYHASTNTASRDLTLLARPYTFTVVQSDMANAFCLPGNHVFVMTGLFQYARTEDELAAVLGHEIAHNLARHAGEKMSGGLVVNLLARSTLLLDPSGLLAMMILPAASIFRELPHSRIQELEADEIGVHLAALACYDPRASKRVFQRMKDGLDGKAPPEFLSTHPSHTSRLAKFDMYMPEVMQTFESNERCAVIRQQMERARLAAARDALLRERQAAQGAVWHDL